MKPDSSYVLLPSSQTNAILTLEGSPENLKRSVDLILEKLRGTKHLDLYQCARVDPTVPIEDTIKTLSGFVKEGKFDHIGMSECKASTLRRGNAVRIWCWL